MDETRQGVIHHVYDAGSVVQVAILRDDGHLHWLAADGNLLRRVQQALHRASLMGLRIEYAVTDWGGLDWIAPLAEGHVVCPNCRKHIPPHLDLDCAWGLHRRKNFGSKNGARAHED